MLINVGNFALQGGEVPTVVKISVEPVEDGNANQRGAEESHIASRPKRGEQPPLPRMRGASIAAGVSSVN
jgi:hypothetical protein